MHQNVLAYVFHGEIIGPARTDTSGKVKIMNQEVSG